MQGKNILIGIASVIAIFAGLWIVWMMTSSTDPKAEEAKALPITINATDLIKGDPSAPITLVEYSDLQCPACKLFAPVVKQLVENNKDLKLVYRHFPLEQHKYAEVAAHAGQAAAAQGKFFEFHDLMFKEQDTWAASKNIDDSLLGYAKTLKLNVDQFKKDMKSSEAKDKVKADYESGIQYGVDSTPSFFLNGKKIDSVQSIDAFQKLIDAERGKLQVKPTEAPQASTPSAEVKAKVTPQSAK